MLTVRRLLVLVRELPPGSRLSVALRGSDHDGWDLHSYLLAGLFDAVQANTHALIQVNSRKRIKAPPPLPRPGKPATAARRVVRVAELPGARQR